MQNIKTLLLCFVLQVLAINTFAGNTSITPPPAGIRIHTPGSDFIQGHFTDAAGNHLFLYTNRTAGNWGSARVLKLSADGEDTLLRSFPLPDTATILYTGFCTPQHTYMFFGQIREDTLLELASFGYLWVLETDTLLQVISSRRISLPQEYRALDRLSGYSLTYGTFTMIGVLKAPNTTSYRDDLFLAMFNSSGDTLKTIIIKQDLHQDILYTIPDPGGQHFSAIISGLNIHVPNERMVVFPEMNYTIGSFIGPPEIGFPISFTWINDSMYLAVGEKHDIVHYFWDVHFCVADIQSVFYLDVFMGSFYNVDIAAFKQSVIHSADNGYYFICAMNAGMFNNPDSIVFGRIDENFNFSWKKYYADNLCYVPQYLFLKPDGNVLVASHYVNIFEPEYEEDLAFFTLDTSYVSGIEPIDGKVAGMPYSISPNPGSDRLCVQSKPWFPGIVRLLDLSGREIISSTAFNGQVSIDVSGVNPGLYLSEITAPDHKRYIFKWIKSNLY